MIKFCWFYLPKKVSLHLTNKKYTLKIKMRFFTRIFPLTNRSYCLQLRFETTEVGDTCHSIEFVSGVETLNKQYVCIFNEIYHFIIFVFKKCQLNHFGNFEFRILFSSNVLFTQLSKHELSPKKVIYKLYLKNSKHYFEFIWFYTIKIFVSIWFFA